MVEYLLGLKKENEDGTKVPAVLKRPNNEELHAVLGISDIICKKRAIEQYIAKNKTDPRRRNRRRKQGEEDKEGIEALPDLKLQLIDCLLREGAEINSQGPDFGPPLYHSSKTSHPPTPIYTPQPPQRTTTPSQSPFLVYRKCDMEFLQALVARGADINCLKTVQDNSSTRYTLLPNLSPGKRFTRQSFLSNSCF